MINMWASIFFIPLNLFEDRKQLKKTLTSYVYYGVYNVFLCVKWQHNTRMDRSRTILLKDHILHKMVNISYK